MRQGFMSEIHNKDMNDSKYTQPLDANEMFIEIIDKMSVLINNKNKL